MKPLHAGILAFCVTVAIGIAVIVTKLPVAEVAPPAVPRVAVATVPTAEPPMSPTLPAKRRRVKSKSFAKQTGPIDSRTIDSRTIDSHTIDSHTTDAHTPFHPWTGSLESGGIFSGVDPNDPRIYH